MVHPFTSTTYLAFMDAMKDSSCDCYEVVWDPSTGKMDGRGDAKLAEKSKKNMKVVSGSQPHLYLSCLAV